MFCIVVRLKGGYVANTADQQVSRLFHKCQTETFIGLKRNTALSSLVFSWYSLARLSQNDGSVSVREFQRQSQLSL